MNERIKLQVWELRFYSVGIHIICSTHEGGGGRIGK